MEVIKMSEELKEIRKRLNMTQMEFADHFGIPLGTLRQWEYARRKPPGYVIAMIKKIIALEKK